MTIFMSCSTSSTVTPSARIVQTIEATNIDVADPQVYVEWRLVARFTNPGFVDDNLLIEPTGRLLETAGVLVVTFSGDQVVSAHCYYDDLALLEQLLTSR